MRFGEMNSIRKHKRRLKTWAVLPNGAAEIVPANEPTLLYFGPSTCQIDCDTTQSVVAINVGKVQFPVRNPVNHFCCRPSQNYTLGGELLGIAQGLSIKFLVNICRLVGGLVPIIEVPPRIDHVVTPQSATFSKQRLGEQPALNTQLGHDFYIALSEKAHPQLRPVIGTFSGFLQFFSLHHQDMVDWQLLPAGE